MFRYKKSMIIYKTLITWMFKKNKIQILESIKLKNKYKNYSNLFKLTPH